LFKGFSESRVFSFHFGRLNYYNLSDKAFKRTANNADTPYHKATHSELLKQNKQLKKDLKLSQIEVEILKKTSCTLVLLLC
jgi:hypothetical protein